MVDPVERLNTAMVTHFSESCEWTGVRDTDRAGWLALRRELFTASDVAAIMGEDPRRDAFDVYVSKVTAPPPAEKLALNDPRLWGKALELTIAHTVADYHGWEIQDGGYLLRSRKHPQIGATLDAEVRRSESEGWLPYEGKTSRMPRDWSESDGSLPTHILIQAQVQLLVTGAPCNIVFALLFGSQPVMVPVYPYPEFHSILADQVEWMADLVTRGEPPTVTARSADSLRRLYPNDNSSTVPLPIEAIEWTREVQQIAAHVTELDARKDMLRNQLRLAIGPATYGELPEPVGGKGAWKWGVNSAGSRSLLAVKAAPGASSGRNLLDAPVQTHALPEADLISKYSTRRRTARR